MNGVPILYSLKEECCGCTACYAICPVKAISMCADAEGFCYPVIDADKCIRCHVCLEICSFKSNEYS